MAAVDEPAVESQQASPAFDPDSVVSLLELVIDPATGDENAARQCLDVLAKKIQTRELAGKQLDELRPRLDKTLAPILSGKADAPLYFDVALLATTWKNPTALAAVRQALSAPTTEAARRLAALDALITAADAEVLPVVAELLVGGKGDVASLAPAVLQALGRLDNAQVADVVLSNYARLNADLQPKAIELLTERTAWSKALLAAIKANRLPTTALNTNQVRKLLSSKDAELVAAVKATWGSLREERDPKREQVILDMRRLIRASPGDPHRGATVFQRVCGQCHKIYGQGADVGPDLTSNGRSSFEQLLSNVFDPSLVIGAAYQAVNVRTIDGRVITGLPTEDNAQRLVLKVQGGKTETIARDDIDESQTSKLSLMPEGLETQIKPDEMRDLFAFLTLDKPPADGAARQLPGVREPLPRATTDPAQFALIVDEVAPGFTTNGSGEGGVALLAEFRGRRTVVQTHPKSGGEPCILRREVEIPAGKRTTLIIDVSHHERGDWQLVVRANGNVLHKSDVGPKTTKDGWRTVTVDLTPLAGKKSTLEVVNQANGWTWEYAYWGAIRIVSE